MIAKRLPGAGVDPTHTPQSPTCGAEVTIVGGDTGCVAFMGQLTEKTDPDFNLELTISCQSHVDVTSRNIFGSIFCAFMQII